MAVFLITEPRCVFLHIPKTGGSSIRHGFFAGKVEGPAQGYIPDTWQELFKFAFVRHPLDRLVSAWKMFADGMQQSVWQQPDDGNRGISLRRFLDHVLDDTVPFDGIRDTTPKKIRHHAIPQTHPFHCLEQADFVGRFENLSEDFAKVLEKMGIAGQRLPHWNRTHRDRDFRQYFDAQSLEIAREFYAEDFSQLGYNP